MFIIKFIFLLDSIKILSDVSDNYIIYRVLRHDNCYLIASCSR